MIKFIPSGTKDIHQYGVKILCDERDRLYICYLYVPKHVLTDEYVFDSVVKYRCEYAIVLAIVDVYTFKTVREITHISFSPDRTKCRYVSGETVYPDNYGIFNPTYCTGGIYFMKLIDTNCLKYFRKLYENNMYIDMALYRLSMIYAYDLYNFKKIN